ncbi:MAG: TetR/AcrR family transcriptional regulator [Pseudomonadota bacterium]
MTIDLKPRRRRSALEAKSEILDAAEALLVEKGPQSLKISDVAKRAGMGHSLLVHHFGGIADIQQALAIRMSTRLGHQVEEMIQMSDPATPLISEIIDQIFDIFGREENAKLIAWLALSGQSDKTGVLADQGRRIAGMISKKLQETGREALLTPELVSGLQTLPMMVAVGEALGRKVFSDAVLQTLPTDQTRQWTSDLIKSKIGLSD